jgi:hypothetical protein
MYGVTPYDVCIRACFAAHAMAASATAMRF